MAVTSTVALCDRPREVGRTVVKNSAANATRLAVTALVSILLPAYLTHRLPVKTYAAWVLILQLSAYVGYLDFGVQTAVSKHIAEYDVKQDFDGCGRYVSTGLVIMLLASVLGVALTVGLAWRGPAIFPNMPQALCRDVRISILFVGISLSISLATSVFGAIFVGLQQYQVPMAVTIISRLLFGAVVCLSASVHSSLAIMGAGVACVNIFTGLLQYMVWRKLAPHIRVSLHLADLATLKRMLGYCAVLTVWSVCMLFVNGLDITIVGHYSFNQTAYYSVASSPTTFVLMITAALMGPLLPVTSALSVHSTSAEMGRVLLRSTRYATVILLLTGLPLVVAGYAILRLWVGPAYAANSIGFLRILVVANIIRNLCSPYATMVVATSRQRVATASALTEGIVNLVSSIWLARHIGALGVALGTLLGAVAGVAMHYGVSMRYTQANLALPRMELFVKGMVRPAVIAIPSILLFRHWLPAGAPAISFQLYVAWALATLLLAWFVSIPREDRSLVARVVSGHGNSLERVS
jgi:O-antigen/teichoic acid export membrane protein